MTPAKKRRNSWIAIGIIALPFVWTIPTFFYLRADTSKKNNWCQSNLKQLGLAFLQYQDDKGAFPSSTNWTKPLGTYVDGNDVQKYRCPSDLKTEGFSYAMNANLSGKKLSEIKNPSQVILLYETNSKQSTPFGVGKDMVDIGKPKNGQGRHNLVGYRFNFFLMADGTVRQAGTPDEKKPLRWTP